MLPRGKVGPRWPGCQLAAAGWLEERDEHQDERDNLPNAGQPSTSASASDETSSSPTLMFRLSRVPIVPVDGLLGIGGLATEFDPSLLPYVS